MGMESKLQSKVMQYLQTLDQSWWYKASDRFTSGIPDIIGAIKGSFIAIELKAPGGKASEIQKYTHLQLKKAGVDTLVTDDFEEVVKWVEEYI